ncbi:MAG: hypothetical protein WC349_03820 [Patescibacteria group bacterium]|jgi:hypothetical protein
MVTEEHVQKLKEGRLKHLEETQGLICKIDDKIEIWADKYQFVLKINGQTEGYFPDIISVINELIDIKMKQLMLFSDSKNLQSVKQAVEDTKEWVEKIVKPLLNPKTEQPKS